MLITEYPGDAISGNYDTDNSLILFCSLIYFILYCILWLKALCQCSAQNILWTNLLCRLEQLLKNWYSGNGSIIVLPLPLPLSSPPAVIGKVTVRSDRRRSDTKLAGVLFIHEILRPLQNTSSLAASRRFELLRPPSISCANAVKVTSRETACECSVKSSPSLLIQSILIFEGNWLFSWEIFCEHN